MFIAAWGLSLVAVSGATLHWGVQASLCGGLSCCGARALGARASVVANVGLVAARHVGSSRTRARTQVPCIGRQILNHCATREAQNCKSWITPWDPYEMPLVILEVFLRSREKSWRYKKSWIARYVPEIEVCSCGCQSFQDKWIQHKDHCKNGKGNSWSCQCSYTSRHKKLALLARYLSTLPWKCSFCVGVGLLL